jgi:uncharacterized protein (PEP-CTERM system associated)
MSMRIRSGQIYLFMKPSLYVVFCAGFTGNVFAANWEGSASIAPSLAYTDNVCLSKDNKKSDWTGVGILTPSGSVSQQSRKTSFNARGSVQVNTLTDGDLRDNGCSGDNLGDRQNFFPSLSANGFTVVVDDYVKLNASLRADQNEITSALPSSSDGLNRNGNTNTFYRYSVSPVLSHRIKKQAFYTVRYSYDDVINTSDSVSDSTRHALTTSLANGQASQISWDLSGRYSKVMYNDDVINQRTGLVVPRQDTELKSASMSMGYQIDRRWQVNGRYGWEWNDFQTYNNANTGGNAWDLGVRWTPSANTTVNLGSGDRFFGKTPRVNIMHKRKRSLFRLSYNKTITYQRNINTLGNPYYNGVGLDEEFISDEDLQNELIDGQGYNSSIYSNGPILDERATLGYTYSGRRATLNVFGSYSDQTRQEDGAQGVFKNISMTFSPLVSRKYTVSGSITWDEDDPLGYVGAPNQQDFSKSSAWYYSVQWARPLNNRMSVSLNYQYTDRQSDDSFNEYQENRVIATLSISL